MMNESLTLGSKQPSIERQSGKRKSTEALAGKPGEKSAPGVETVLFEAGERNFSEEGIIRSDTTDFCLERCGKYLHLNSCTRLNFHNNIFQPAPLEQSGSNNTILRSVNLTSQRVGYF